MITGITLYASQNREVVTYYDLLPASFNCRAGTGDELKKMQVWPAEEAFQWDAEEWRWAV